MLTIDTENISNIVKKMNKKIKTNFATKAPNNNRLDKKA